MPHTAQHSFFCTTCRSRQARIRFALDDATWRRLRGCHEGLPAALQANLSEAEATDVWCSRLQAAVDALAERFHTVYGPPQQIHVLGGNAGRCHGRVTHAQYMTPDSVHEIRHTSSIHTSSIHTSIHTSTRCTRSATRCP